eukprot:2662437-Alexandrium_andersonii.AAC.1
MSCPSKCGSTVVLPARPCRVGSSWPKVRCVACGKVARCGVAECRVCGSAVMACKCRPTQTGYERTESRQGLITAFFRAVG